MNNLNRVTEVIGDWIDSNLPHSEQNFGADEGIAEALDDANLLAPDLPDHIETSPDNMPDMYTNGGHVYAVLNNGYDSDWERLDPSKATEFALRLLAAAEYAEKEEQQ